MVLIVVFEDIVTGVCCDNNGSTAEKIGVTPVLKVKIKTCFHCNITVVKRRETKVRLTFVNYKRMSLSESLPR
jgi:hypothetical protein